MTTEPAALLNPLSAAVLAITKSAQHQSADPFTWATRISSTLNSAGVVLPSPEVAELLVSHICWSNNVPLTWKYLDMALSMKIVPSMLVLALLAARVIPHRRSHPVAYRLFMELIKMHMFSLTSEINSTNYDRIMKSVDDVLLLSQLVDLQGAEAAEPGVLVVQFVFSIVWQLVDASLLDEGLLGLTKEKKSRWDIELQAMDIDHGKLHEKRIPEQERMYKLNTVMAIEISGELLKSKVGSRILYLARRNMPSSWACFSQHVQLLAAHSLALRSSQCITPEVLLESTFNNYDVSNRDSKTNLQKPFHAVIAGPLLSSASLYHGTSPSSLWLPIDLFLEESLDASQVTAISAGETVAGLVKALHAVNQTTWQETFLGLWTSALRLVQRERYPYEIPISCLDACMCILLSVIPLAIKNIIEEETAVVEAADFSGTTRPSEIETSGKLQNDLIFSLQQLGDYEKLLIPPPTVVAVADQAATRAMMFLSGVIPENGYPYNLSLKASSANGAGNLRHLIVEACIARDLVDTSAYLWPGYVKDRSYQASNSVSGQVPAWSLLMKGSPLTPALVDALVSTPASCLAEIEKVYEIAVNGSDSEKISAASILCGASLIRGWNIVEHTVLVITNLLSPPVPADYSGNESYLISCAPFLNALLFGISSTVCTQIFSLLGMVPQLAGALMSICEKFGSCAPEASWTRVTGDEVSSHVVFSSAFTLLLRLWRFDRPPLEHSISDVTPVGSQLTPEYLLLVRNSQLASHTVKPKYQYRRSQKLSLYSNPSSTEPIFMDSFPKLTHWYRQHQECIVSPVSSQVYKRSDHQIVDRLLNMMFSKADRGGQPTTSQVSSTSSSSGSMMDEASSQLKLPAWDILETIPVVLDASLTACAHGRLSPRELATGLKCLADSLPATIATIASYFSAEVTRGIWKPASMNGTDWPSPAANLANIEQNIKKILAETGVDVPSLAKGGSSPPTLPLPLAALISLTITYKLDGASERLLFLVGPAMDTLAAGCPWPCLPILASLWAQKVKRWSDYLIFSASRTVFHHNSDAVYQLLRRCFTCTLGLGPDTISTRGGVAALLDHDSSSFSGVISPVAPGIFYLRVHRCVKNTTFIGEEIVSCVMQSVKDIVVSLSGLPEEKKDKLKKTKYGQASLSVAMTRVKLAASLGASLIWITGGISLVQFLIKETLPSFFMSSVHKLVPEEDEGQKPDWRVSMLRGCALAYLAVLTGTFAWGVDSSLPTSKWRRNVLMSHFKFIASAVNGQVSISCDHATWRTYVTTFLSLMVKCTPIWMQEIDVNVLKRLSEGLRQWDEEELGFALLSRSGVAGMGAAAEFIIECQ